MRHLIDDKFRAAWRHMQEHLLSEMACGEPEGQEVMTTIDGVMDKLLADPEPSDGSIHEDLLELADSIELNLDRTVEPEAARQNIELFRRAADIVRVHETDLEELADLRVRTGVANAQLDEIGGKLDEIAEMISPGVRETRVDDGKDTSWKAPDTVDLVREFVAQRRVFPADLVLRASMLAMALEQVGGEGAGPTTTADAAKLLFELVRAADQRPELVNDRFVDLNGLTNACPQGHLPAIVASIGARCHDVGPEPEDEDGEHEETLGERCKVTSDNLSTLLGPIGGETQVPEPLWSGVVTASVLLDEVADTLRLRNRRWWVIEDMADGRDERSTIYAIPHDDGARDKAILQWAMTLELIAAAEEDRDPRDDVFDTAVGTLAFRPEHTVAWLEQHPGMLYFVQPPGAVKLVEAIAALAEDESLMIDDGSVVTTYRDSDEREVRELFRLLDFCDSDDDGVRTALSAFDGADELDEEEAEDRATRAAENAADHEDFARQTDPPPRQQTLAAHYFRSGWDLGVQVDGSTTHLLADRDGHRGEGGTACGDLVKVEFIKPMSDALDFPEHPRLCGRCCAAANDRRGETVT